jgi:hypothetical protein
MFGKIDETLYMLSVILLLDPFLFFDSLTKFVGAKYLA